MVWALVSAYRDWKALGALPGGAASVMDCPAYVVEAFRAIACVDQEIEIEEHRRAMAEARKG